MSDRPAKAIAPITEALSIFEERLGPNHPNSITVRRNLAALQQKLQG